MPAWNLHIYVLISLENEDTYRLWKEKPRNQPSPKTLDLQSFLPLRCARAMVEQTCGSGQPMFGLT